MHRIVSLCDGRQVSGRGVNDRGVGRGSAPGAVPAGAGAGLIAVTPGNQLEERIDDFADGGMDFCLPGTPRVSEKVAHGLVVHPDGQPDKVSCDAREEGGMCPVERVGIEGAAAAAPLVDAFDVGVVTPHLFGSFLRSITVEDNSGDEPRQSPKYFQVSESAPSGVGTAPSFV